MKPRQVPGLLGNTFFGLLSYALVFGGLFLFLLAVPRGHAASADSVAPSSALATNAATPASTKLQAERRQEIRQRRADNSEAEDSVNVYRHSPMVDKLAHSFGLSVEVTARMFELLNFAILVGLILWFLARVLPKTLRARTERIQNQLQQARTVSEEAHRRMADVEERLARLGADIDAIKANAHRDAVEKEKQLRVALEQEKQAILVASAHEIATATSKAQSQLKRITAELVLERAQQNLKVAPEADRSLVESFVTDLDRKPAKRGVN